MLSAETALPLVSQLRHPTYAGGPQARIDAAYSQARRCRLEFLAGENPMFTLPDSQLPVKYHLTLDSGNPDFLPFVAHLVESCEAVEEPKLVIPAYTLAEATAVCLGVGRASLPPWK